MLKKKTFEIGLTILSVCGLKIEEKHQIETWWRLLKDLEHDLFQEAVLEICKEKEQWWPSDNVPGMIRTKLKDIKRIKNKEKRYLEQNTQQQEWQENRSPAQKLQGEKKNE